MVQNHLSRLAAPKSWAVKRKTNKFIARPLSGPHALKQSLTLNYILKDLLGYAKTTQEVKLILNNGDVLINNVARKEHRFPVGVMDLIEIKKTQELFRVLFDKKGRIVLVPVKDNVKLSKIIGKTVIRKGKLQVNLHDGCNVLANKFEGKVGDSVIIGEKGIKNLLKLEKGSSIYLIGGKHIGIVGKVKDIIIGSGFSKSKVIYEFEGKDYETLKKYAFVVGKSKSEVTLQ